ncbi:MAG: hypothetical protein LBD75_04505, partial [Candidatus Peribacteria bacterium]|jgi:hypothetical protein|nr:hypothetical protein [Candidatus Peribacteria bacterium]
VIAIQIFAYLVYDEQEDFVDGISGTNTQAAAKIIQGKTAENNKEKKWQEKHHQYQKNIKTLNTTSSNSVKSMKETSILDIRGNETLTTFLQQKGETNPITPEQRTQRHREGVVKAIAPKLEEILSEEQISSLLNEQGEVKPQIGNIVKVMLLQKGVKEKEI